MTIKIETKREDPKAMFLRTAWASGETSDGVEFEISQSGTTLILELGRFSDEDERVVETLSIQALATGWLESLGKS